MPVLRLPLLRITNGFDKLYEGRLINRALDIVSKMNGNPNFQTPDPSLPVVTAAIQAYQTAVTAAMSGNKYDRDVRDDKRTELINLLHLLGAFVLYQSKMDATVAESSGFTIAKPATYNVPVTNPQNLTAADGINSGEVALAFQRVPRAKSYLYQWAKLPLNGETVWQSQNGTTRKAVIKGLERGVEYGFRVAALGTDGQIAYSDTVTWLAR